MGLGDPNEAGGLPGPAGMDRPSQKTQEGFWKCPGGLGAGLELTWSRWRGSDPLPGKGAQALPVARGPGLEDGLFAASAPGAPPSWQR